ncbi:hypothetical protein LUZ61_014823 [Rhynchospora tenuis]|uniref:Uncharacterized protein n=1 Tax=Rhynchospora tenuis TaxID=198213 RepID=A0AAD5Z3D4_9POAL|nr:hypothetical protein LUZ61_014823 [Rhynchospora tenuis]
MASACKSAACCIEAHEPVRATYMNLYKWPESDAEFVRSLAVKKVHPQEGHHQFNTQHSRNEKRKHGQNPVVVDSYSCRQIYLRSYTFSKKETVPEKTMKCFGSFRDKVASFPFLQQSDENLDCRSSKSVSSEKVKKRKKKKKGSVTAKNVREATCNMVWLIFHRLLTCAASVDVVDR